jgi:hypothetical protein
MCVSKMTFKIIFRLTCSIITHIMYIDEKLECFLGTIQTYFYKLPHNNYNNIQMWSKKLQIRVVAYFCP